MTEDIKYAEIDLPYHKQGDDLGWFLSENKNTVPDALELHAVNMDTAAKQLRAVKKLIGDTPVKIHADTHMIQISGPASLINALVAAELAWIPDWYDEEDCCDCELCCGDECVCDDDEEEDDDGEDIGVAETVDPAPAGQ